MSKVASVLVGLALGMPAVACASDPWTPPTAAELAMTSIPEVPGAGAVILYKEQKTTDWDATTAIYVRIKILNESGKDRANIELPFGGFAETRYRDIEGRTVSTRLSKCPTRTCWCWVEPLLR